MNAAVVGVVSSLVEPGGSHDCWVSMPSLRCWTNDVGVEESNTSHVFRCFVMASQRGRSPPSQKGQRSRFIFAFHHSANWAHGVLQTDLGLASSHAKHVLLPSDSLVHHIQGDLATTPSAIVSLSLIARLLFCGGVGTGEAHQRLTPSSLNEHSEHASDYHRSFRCFKQ